MTTRFSAFPVEKLMESFRAPGTVLVVLVVVVVVLVMAVVVTARAISKKVSVLRVV